MYEVLSGLGFYNLNPQSIRELQSPDSGERLSRDGGNLAAVVRNLSKQTQNRRERILEYMKMIVPGLDDVKAKTLRALGVLAALFQSAHAHDLMPPVAVEEPEMALHPAAAGVLFDALLEASFSRQVLVTSHSPDLLDRPNIPPESILAVLNQNGRTVIAPIEPGEREALSHQLRTVGELLRIDQLRPDLEKVPKYGNLQLPLFTEK